MAGTNDKAKGHGLGPREEDTGVGWGLACRRFINEDSCGQWGQCPWGRVGGWSGQREKLAAMQSQRNTLG